MNKRDFRDAVYRGTGYPTDDQLVTETVIDEAVNSALQLIADEADWPWLHAKATLNTVANTATYALTTVASDLLFVERLTDPNGYPITEREPFELEETYANTPGTPEFFAVSEDNIFFRPIPNAVLAYSLYYVRAEKTLTADTDTPYLPSRYHDAVVAFASGFVHEIGERPERAAASMNRYEKVWRPRMSRAVERTSTPRQMRIRPGSLF